MAWEGIMVAITVFGMLVIFMMSLNMDDRKQVSINGHVENPVEEEEQKKAA
jgi:hypothetical protein